MRVAPVRSRLTAAAACFVLALSVACQGAGTGADDEAGASGAQPTAHSTAEPTSGSTGEPDEPSGAVNPCTLLDQSDYREWSPTPRVAQRYLQPGSASWSVCSIPPTNPERFHDIVFGYEMSTTSADFDRYAAMVDGTERAPAGTEVGPVEGIPDAEGLWYSPLSLPTQPVLIRAMARRATHTVTVEWSGFPVGPAEMAPLLEKMLDQATPAWHEHPIDLPQSCPAVDDPLLTAVIEQVDYARGSEMPGDHWFCNYAGDIPGIGQSQLLIRAKPAGPDLVQARLADFDRIENDDADATAVTVRQPNPRTTIGSITDYDGEHVTVVNRDGAVMLVRLTPDLPHVTGGTRYLGGLPRKPLDRFAIRVAEPVIERAELP